MFGRRPQLSWFARRGLATPACTRLDGFAWIVAVGASGNRSPRVSAWRSWPGGECQGKTREGERMEGERKKVTEVACCGNAANPTAGCSSKPLPLVGARVAAGGAARQGRRRCRRKSRRLGIAWLPCYNFPAVTVATPVVWNSWEHWRLSWTSVSLMAILSHQGKPRYNRVKVARVSAAPLWPVLPGMTME